MEELRILIVEDDKNKRDDYSRFIKAYNLDNQDCNIIEEFGVDKNDAIDKLKNPENKYDGAIVDLDLEGSGGTDSSGNEVVIEIKGNLRFPTFVITGTPHHLFKELDVPSAIFGVFERDDVDLDKVFHRFYEIKRTGILNLLNRNGRIEELIQNIFWNHISTSLDNWTQDRKRTSAEKEDSLLRYTILHMLEYLDESKVHPSEFYITRPVKEQLSTGDLISLDGNRYVILTPACDFVYHKEKRKVEKVFLLKIKELDSVPEFQALQGKLAIEELSSSKKSDLSKLITNSSKPFYHYIPKHNSIDAGIIDFQDKLSVLIDEIEAKIETDEVDRFATISMPFLKDLIERYSSYYARQGSPDFDADEIINSLL
jgi:hypothetical protein